MAPLRCILVLYILLHNVYWVFCHMEFWIITYQSSNFFFLSFSICIMAQITSLWLLSDGHFPCIHSKLVPKMSNKCWCLSFKDIICYLAQLPLTLSYTQPFLFPSHWTQTDCYSVQSDITSNQLILKCLG